VVVPAPCPLINLIQPLCDGRLGDANADGSVTPADGALITSHVVGSTPVMPCIVCADATWDFGTDMKDALAIGQAAAGLRVLPW
jgi:hypothetical protein